VGVRAKGDDTFFIAYKRKRVIFVSPPRNNYGVVRCEPRPIVVMVDHLWVPVPFFVIASV
jgi:hypothetical protein